MKIEAGKLYYRMRNGGKAIIHWQDPSGFFHGSFEKDKNWYPYCWDKVGTRGWSSEPGDRDLVAEWEEPKPRKIAYYGTVDHKVYLFTDEESKVRSIDSPALVRVPWLDEPEESE